MASQVTDRDAAAAAPSGPIECASQTEDAPSSGGAPLAEDNLALVRQRLATPRVRKATRFARDVISIGTGCCSFPARARTEAKTASAFRQSRHETFPTNRVPIAWLPGAPFRRSGAGAWPTSLPRRYRDARRRREASVSMFGSNLSPPTHKDTLHGIRL